MLRREFKDESPPDFRKNSSIVRGRQRIGKLLLAAHEARYSRLRTGALEWHEEQHRLSLKASDPVTLRRRGAFYRRTIPGAPEDITVYSFASISYPRHVHIGNRVTLSRGAFITAPAPVVIGSNVLIGPFVVINSGSHRFDALDRPIRDQGHELGEILIEDDAWLGANVTVTPGVTIGSGAVVAAGAVVTRDVPAGHVVGGVPARLIRERGRGASDTHG